MSARFRVGLSADFLLSTGATLAPDLGLGVLEGHPGLAYEFMDSEAPEYPPGQLAPYDVVISLKPRVTAASLGSAERLCAIGRCGVGYDNVDLEACTRADVAVFITPPAVIRPMAESVVLFVLSLSHGLVRKDRLLRAGRWSESLFPLGREPRDRTIGFIGLGGIASEAVRLLKPFDPAAILAHDPYVDPARAASLGVEIVGLNDLLLRSDYVVVLCPLTPETRGLIGAAELARMKPSAYLINVARGPIVQQAALVAALESRQIAGAALDVFEQEPLTDSSNPLLQLDNVVLSSHSIGWTEELFRDMGRCDCEGALAVYRGEAPQHVVNPAVLTRPGFARKLERYREAYEGREAVR